MSSMNELQRRPLIIDSPQEETSAQMLPATSHSEYTRSVEYTFRTAGTESIAVLATEMLRVHGV